jgi:four helix bundle protein
MRQFEDVELWHYSKKFTIDIYQRFKTCRDFNFKDQIQRAALSVMNNIAEGLERNGDRELRRFLVIAKGSCGEVRSMLHVASELKTLSNQDCREFINRAAQISRMLGGFIKSLKTIS